MSSNNLRPKSCVTAREQRVFAGIPPNEMWRLCVQAMGFARRPDFMQQVRAWYVGATMQIVGDATVFLAGGADERAEFRFEQGFLTFARFKQYDESDRLFRQLCVFRRFA